MEKGENSTSCTWTWCGLIIYMSEVNHHICIPLMHTYGIHIWQLTSFIDMIKPYWLRLFADTEKWEFPYCWYCEQKRWTFPMARPKCLMRYFTNSNGIYKAQSSDKYLRNHESFPPALITLWALQIAMELPPCQLSVFSVKVYSVNAIPEIFHHPLSFHKEINTFFNINQ